MLFNSQTFSFLFLPRTLAGYYALAGSRRLRQAWVTCASIALYAHWDVRAGPLPRGRAVWETLGRGLVLFIIGLGKKVILADTLAHLADPAFFKVATSSLTAAEAWVGGLAFTFQLYFDFSGYSDMAIGLALMFGL